MGKERQRAEEFTTRLRETYGEELVTVVLYGSAARGDYREGVSDLNLLVVLRALDAGALRRGSALARSWVEQGNQPPLMLGEAEWRGSADVFPIEYSDIRDAHVVLHGEDPWEGFDIRWGDLRLQCEHELKTKQIRLREQYLLCSERPEELGRLLRESFPTFLTLFRTCLRLAGAPVPREPDAVITAIAALAAFDPAAFREVYRARVGSGSFTPAGDGAVATGYLQSVERTTHWLDQLAEPAR